MLTFSNRVLVLSVPQLGDVLLRQTRVELQGWVLLCEQLEHFLRVELVSALYQRAQFVFELVWVREQAFDERVVVVVLQFHGAAALDSGQLHPHPSLLLQRHPVDGLEDGRVSALYVCVFLTQVLEHELFEVLFEGRFHLVEAKN